MAAPEHPNDPTTGLPRLRKPYVKKQEVSDPTGHIPLKDLCAPLSAKHIADATFARSEGYLGPNHDIAKKKRSW